MRADLLWSNEKGYFSLLLRSDVDVVASLRLHQLKLGSYEQVEVLTCTRCCPCFCNLRSFWSFAVVCVRPGTFLPVYLILRLISLHQLNPSFFCCKFLVRPFKCPAAFSNRLLGSEFLFPSHLRGASQFFI